MLEILSSFSGVLVNTVTVIIGSCVGLLLKKQIPEKLTGAVMTAIGLCTIAIGIGGIIKGQNQLVMIISLVLGTIVGTLIDIDGKLSKLGDKLSKKKKSISGMATSVSSDTAMLVATMETTSTRLYRKGKISAKAPAPSTAPSKISKDPRSNPRFFGILRTPSPIMRFASASISSTPTGIFSRRKTKKALSKTLLSSVCNTIICF